MEPRRPGENAGRYRGADRAWVREGNLMPLAEGLLESGATGPGVEAFFRQLSRFPEDAMAAYSLLALSPLFHDSRAAEQDILYTALQEQNAASAGNNVEAFLSGKPYFSPPFESNIDPNALLERTAPSMIAPLASTGRLPEALQVLERIHDPAAWSTAFQNLLPAWMDADPAAARAAFNTAPLTALERERLQRLPAFLLSR
jgi:hypothetical protein